MQSLELLQLLIKFRYLLLFGGIGVILILSGFFIYKSGVMLPVTKVEVLSESTTSATPKIITVEISGEVNKKGVYKMPEGSRIDDLILTAGGLTGKEDTTFTDKYLNRAAKISDGQKVFIPSAVDHSVITSANSGGVYQNISSTNTSDSSALININTSSLSDLDKLPGIGPVYGQNIIEHRPYSTTEELVSRGVIKQSVYQKIKSLISVY